MNEFTKTLSSKKHEFHIIFRLNNKIYYLTMCRFKQRKLLDRILYKTGLVRETGKKLVKN